MAELNDELQNQKSLLSELDELNNKYTKFNKDIKIEPSLSIEESNLLDYYNKSKNKEEARKHIEFLYKYQDKFYPRQAEINIKEKRYHELLAKEEINSKQINIKQLTFDNKETIYKIKKNVNVCLDIILCLLFIIGSLMAYDSFKNWYNLLQKPLDEKILAEIKKLKSDNQ